MAFDLLENYALDKEESISLLRRVYFPLFNQTLTGLIKYFPKNSNRSKGAYFSEYGVSNHPLTQSCFIFIFLFYLMRVRIHSELTKIFQIFVLSNARSVSLNDHFSWKLE